jgi:hypothetical protein
VNRPRLRSWAALAPATAATVSACSRFQVASDVEIPRVPISLTFGAKPPAPPDFGFVPSLPPAFILPPPILPPPPPPDDGDEELCPPVKAVGARDAAVTEITDANKPKPGTYLFRFAWNYSGQEDQFLIGYKSVSASQNETNGFIFFVKDPHTGIEWNFESHPRVDNPDDPNSQLSGFFLRQLLIPQNDKGDKLIPFRPAQQGLRILNYPITDGDHVTSSAPDTAVKSDVPNSPNPLLVTPPRSEIVSDVIVGSREIIDVCADLAQAWKINWTLRISGGYNVYLSGSFWLATQYGGWPIREEYFIDGDLVKGNFASQMMRLDPGDYL